jgi:hypothetical protein
MSISHLGLTRTSPDLRRILLALAGLVTGGLTAFLLA